jgi:hypothetical protein
VILSGKYEGKKNLQLVENKEKLEEIQDNSMDDFENRILDLTID